MNYLRSLFLNFLVVFFVDRMGPGMSIDSYEQVPNIGADILFSAILGFLNASVFPFLFILELNPTKLKIGIITFIISYTAFIVIAIIPFGVRAESATGVIVGGLIVWAMAFFTNSLEFDRDMKNLK
jgi:uncharacterized membrane protein YvlD (DUF360 family)